MNCDFSCDAFNQYRVDLPYPKVIVDKRNLDYARLVSGAYAGRGSEMTAIAQYTSHRYFIQEYPEIYTAYKYLSFVEMIHFDLLGHLVMDLGLRPAFFSYESSQYWNGSFPAYKRDLIPILEADIQEEKNAIAHYQRMIDLIDNESIQALFRRIILDEEKHIEVLTGFYQAQK